MKPIERITLLCTLGVLAYACGPDKRLVGPDAAKPLAAEAAGVDQPAYGPWGTPVNLGPVVNSPANEQHPAISKDGLSLYVSSDRPGGLGGTDIWVSQRASVDDPWGARLLLRSEEHTSELQSHHDLVCRLLLEKKKKNKDTKQN